MKWSALSSWWNKDRIRDNSKINAFFGFKICVLRKFHDCFYLLWRICTTHHFISPSYKNSIETRNHHHNFPDGRHRIQNCLIYNQNKCHLLNHMFWHTYMPYLYVGRSFSPSVGPLVCPLFHPSAYPWVTLSLNIGKWGFVSIRVCVISSVIFFFTSKVRCGQCSHGT